MDDKQASIGTVARVVRILQVFSEASDDVSIKELSAITSLAPSTCHRLLHLLIEDDVVAFDADRKRYHAGPEFIRIASLLASKTSFSDIALPFMERVVEVCREACAVVSYLRPRKLISTVGILKSSNPLQYNTELFTARTPLWGATGQSIVAFLPRAEQEELYDARDSDFYFGTQTRLPPREEYLAKMETIKEQGYAKSHGQTIDGAVGIGAPLYDKFGRVTGSLCVTVPEMRFDADAHDRIIGILIPQAQALSKVLGYLGTPAKS